MGILGSILPPSPLKMERQLRNITSPWEGRATASEECKNLPSIIQSFIQWVKQKLIPAEVVHTADTLCFPPSRDNQGLLWLRPTWPETHPQVGDGQGVPVPVVHQVGQVTVVGGDEGSVVEGQTHGLGLLVAHVVGHVRAHHQTRVRLVQRHQVELKIQDINTE